MELKRIREKIDEMDEQIVALIEDRFNLAREVANYKSERELPILDKEREQEVIERSVSYLTNKVDGENIKDIFERIMNISRNIQREIIVTEKTSIKDLLGDIPLSSPVQNPRVGFQGVVGSYSEEALNGFFPVAEKVSYPKFTDVIVALLAGEVDYGIFPIENTSTGGILDVERLLEKHPVYIVGEQVVPINQCLLGVGEITDITTVYSHAQGFLQCAPYLEERNWNLIPYFNTATSAKLVAEKNDKKIAAIASRRAAEVYGLKILGDGINYNNKNYTRFVVLKTSMEVKKTNDKVSVQFILDHTEGALYRVIKSISENHLNMSKIESKPIVGVPWEYTFFIDFAGNIEEPNVMRALMEIKENSREFQFKGNYTGYRSM